MRLLVTGGTGLLGRALVARATARRWDVTATHLSQPAPDGAAAWRRLDARDREAVFDCVRRARPDAVIHTAYVQQGPSLRALTVDGARSVAEAAREVGARLVHLSTDVVFDGALDRPYAEDDPVSPAHDYGRAKADAERLVLDAHPDAAVVRTSLLYGLSADDRQARLALDLASGRQRGALFTDETRNPAMVDDVAASLLELTETAYRGVLHLAGRDAVSRHAFGALLVAFHGGDPAALPGARSADQPVRRPRNCALSSERARSVLRSVPRGVFEVLRRT
jgi:dTDP-4-dehydrorhamnose reductase